MFVDIRLVVDLWLLIKDGFIKDSKIVDKYDQTGLFLFVPTVKDRRYLILMAHNFPE
jgi:hypothetical protein